MTQFVFGTAWVGRIFLGLFPAWLRIRFHMWTRICYVTDFGCAGEISGEHRCVFLGVFLVSSVKKYQTVLELLLNWVAPH